MKLFKNKEGFIKENVTLARVGSMDYLGSELDMGLNPSEVYQVYVTADELFKPEVLESADGITVTMQHPDSLEVTLDGAKDGWQQVVVGHVQNIRTEGDYLKGTIFVKDKNAIQMIEEQGIKEVSLGYDSNIVEKDGKLIKTNIRANHLAIVPEGRCGSACKIGDSQKVKTKMAKKPVALKVGDSIAKMFGLKTSSQKAMTRKFGDAKKSMTSKAKKLGDASESLKQKLADLEEVNVNPDATPEEKAAASQELQVEVVDTINEAVTALQESIGLVSDVEEEVAAMPTAVGDAMLPEGVSIPDELASYVSDLEQEKVVAEEKLAEAELRIKELEDKIAAMESASDTATAVADAKARFPKLKFNDSYKSPRHVRQHVLTQKNIYADAQAVKMGDCDINSAYYGIAANTAPVQSGLGKKLLGDAKTKSKLSANQRLGGK